MDEYLAAGIFAEPFRGFILTERIFADNPPGARRRWGLIIAVDLEKYDFSPDARTLIRPTEATISGRLPPRADIRRGAPLELPHAMLLADDRECSLIEPLAAEAAADRRRIIYDFELLAGGGHIRGYAVTGKALQKAAFAVERLLASAESASDAPMLFAVGDGNHSLAAAKMCWDELRARIPEAQQKAHPARYTLVELLNLHSEAAVFEPIHRAVYNISYKDALDEICAYFKDNGVSVTVSEQAAPETAAPSPRAGFAYKIIYGCGKTMVLHVEKPKAKLAATEIQRFIDYLCGKYRTVAIDYIHGADELSRLAREEGCVCLELPPVEKKEFFSFVSQHGIMPNKAFSLGNAKEKRHYLEARRIAP